MGRHRGHGVPRLLRQVQDHRHHQGGHDDVVGGGGEAHAEEEARELGEEEDQEEVPPESLSTMSVSPKPMPVMVTMPTMTPAEAVARAMPTMPLAPHSGPLGEAFPP